jgi:hypothetical protein
MVFPPKIRHHPVVSPATVAQSSSCPTAMARGAAAQALQVLSTLRQSLWQCQHRQMHMTTAAAVEQAWSAAQMERRTTVQLAVSWTWSQPPCAAAAQQQQQAMMARPAYSSLNSTCMHQALVNTTPTATAQLAEAQLQDRTSMLGPQLLWQQQSHKANTVARAVQGVHQAAPLTCSPCWCLVRGGA